jgi:four helix bundle protein
VQNFSSKPDNGLRSRSYRFGLGIIHLCDNLPQKRSAWIIADQLIRAAMSIGANVVEAKASSSRLEFKKFFEIALKSSNETVYWLSLLRDSELLPPAEINSMITECRELGKMLGKSVLTLKGK